MKPSEFKKAVKKASAVFANVRVWEEDVMYIQISKQAAYRIADMSHEGHADVNARVREDGDVYID